MRYYSKRTQETFPKIKIVQVQHNNWFFKWIFKSFNVPSPLDLKLFKKQTLKSLIVGESSQLKLMSPLNYALNK